MNKSFTTALLFTALFVAAQPGIAQTVDTTDNSKDLETMLDKDNSGTKPSKPYTIATFKSTRIINGHSIENVGKGVLDFRISHRFGTLNQGAKNFYGLDNATTKLGFDYGVTNWLMVGIGRSTYEKEYDGYIKAKLYRQTDDNKHPVTVSYVGAMSVRTFDVQETPGQEYYFSNRLFYANQLLIARKVCKWLSVQLMPTHVHYNLVPTSGEPNDVLAMGIGGRLKVSNRIALTGEYYYTIPGNKLDHYKNSISAGIDIETGGHVFQLFFTNATGITERSFIGQNTGDWREGDIHFGFNISRVFTIVRPKGFKESEKKKW